VNGVDLTCMNYDLCKPIGGGTNLLILDTQSLEELNNLLARVTYATTMYHIHTGDLGTTAAFQLT